MNFQEVIRLTLNWYKNYYSNLPIKNIEIK